MNIISSLLFALSANTDNLVVGLSYGIKKIKIGPLSNLIISLVTVAGTILSMLLSQVVINFLPINITNIIGSLILIMIGAWTLIKTLSKRINSNSVLNNPEKVDKDNSLDIDVKEAIILAFALSLNNIGLGIGAGITGLNVMITSFFTFVFSLLMIRIGHFLATNYFFKIFNQKAEIISSLIIIALGMIELFC